MKIDKIISDLDKVKEIVSGWDNGMQGGVLERDLVLGKLRMLYENIRFADSKTESTTDAAVSEFVPEQLSLIDLSEMMIEPDFSPTVSVESDAEQFEPSADDIEAAQERHEFEDMEQFEQTERIEELEEPAMSEYVEHDESTQRCEPKEPATQEEQEEELEALEEQEKLEAQEELEVFEVPEEPEILEVPEEPEVPEMSKQQPLEILQSEPVEHITRETGSISQSLFAEDTIAVKQKIDRRVILSLYGDDPEVEVVKPTPSVAVAGDVVNIATSQQSGAAAEAVVESENMFYIEPNVASLPNITTVDKPHSEVLGDVIGKGNQTVGDMMFTVSDKVDVATKVVTENSTTLRKMIGINDKFLMIRDLFSGDAAAYEQAISTLETFKDLDDALIHIHEKYAWNPNVDGAKLLIELLTRKLS